MPNKNAVRTVSSIMAITLAGKILGLFREQLLAWNYGVGMEANAFMTASRIPRIFFDAVFASAITASFIPVFSEYMELKGKKAAFGLANNFITIAVLVTAALASLGALFAAPLTGFFADGYDAETAALCAALLKIMFPIIIFTAIAFIFVGILQSLEEFGVPAAISVASNLVVIFYYIFFNKRFGIFGLAAAFLAGWAAQAVIQIPALMKKGYFFKPAINLRDAGIRKIFLLMIPVMVSTWIQPINFLISSKFASRLYGGAGVSALEYANNLYTIIVGVFVLSVANVVFPRLSKLATGENGQEFKNTISSTMSIMIFFLIPMTVGVMSLSTPIIRLIFEWKNFGVFSTGITSGSLAFLALGMTGFGFQTIGARAFYAVQDGKTPLISGVVSIIVNILLSAFLMEKMEIAGLALAASISQTAAALVLIVPLKKRFGRIFPAEFIPSFIKIIAIALIMGAAVVFARDFLEPMLSGGFAGRMSVLVIPGIIGVLIYAGGTAAAGVPQSKEALEYIKSRIKRS